VWFGLAGIFIATALVLLASAAIVLRFTPERARAHDTSGAEQPAAAPPDKVAG